MMQQSAIGAVVSFVSVHGNFLKERKKVTVQHEGTPTWWSLPWDKMSSKSSHHSRQFAVTPTRRAMLASSSPCSPGLYFRPSPRPHKCLKMQTFSFSSQPFAPINVLFVSRLTARRWSGSHCHVGNSLPSAVHGNTREMYCNAQAVTSRLEKSPTGKYCDWAASDLSLFSGMSLCFQESSTFSPSRVLNHTRMDVSVIALHSYSTSKWHKEQCINCVIWIQFSAAQSQNALLNESTLFCGTQQFVAVDTRPEWASASFFIPLYFLPSLLLQL